MVLDPMTQKQMGDASRGGARGGRKKRGVSTRRKKGRGRTLGAQPQAAAPDGEAPQAEAAAPPAAAEAPPAPVPAAAVHAAATPAPAYKYDDTRVKRAAKNARLKSLAYPAAFGVGAVALWGSMSFGLETWIAAIAATVAASVTWKLVDMQIR